MPEISVRGLEMPESPIRKLAPLAAAAKKKGTKVYHLNIGQPDLPTPKVALDALKTIDRNILEYSPSQGYLSYREKLVDYYAKYDIRVTADDIIITSGGSEAVLFAFLSCLNPGDEIIVPEPAYANYMAFAISAGAKIRTIATTIEEGFSLPKVEKFEELINERTRAIMICNPNNPTGYLYTRREMISLLRRGIPRIYLYRITLYLRLPSGRHRTECHPYRLCIEALQRMWHPYRRPHHEKCRSAQSCDEILSGPTLPAPHRTNSGRGLFRDPRGLPTRCLRRVCGAT